MTPTDTLDQNLFTIPALPLFGWNYSYIRQEINAATNTGEYWEVQIAKCDDKGWHTKHGKGSSPKEAALNALSEVNKERQNENE